MTVRRKLFWLLAVTIFLFTASLVALWIVEQRQLSAIERERFTERREALGRNVGFWGSSLENFTRMFSRSEVLAEAVKNDDKAAADAQFADELLDSYRVPVFWVYRPDNTLFTSKNRLYADGLQDVPLPRSAFERAFAGKSATHFFSKIPAGVVEVRGVVVRPSAGEGTGGAPSAYVFAGRLWNDEEMKELSAFTGNEMRIVQANYSTQGLKLPNGELAFTYPLNGWGGKPVAQVLARVQSPLLEHANWLRMAIWLWAGLFVFGVITALTFGLQRWVWRPLGAITRSVRSEQTVVFPFDKDRTEMGELARLIRSFFEQRELMTKELREERQAFRAARDKEVENRQSRKMEALSRLASSFAHDMNSVLTSIAGYTTMLKIRTMGDDAAQEEATKLREAVEHASALTRKLLAFSGKEAFEPRVLDLNQMVLGMEQKLREMLPDSIRMRISAEAPESFIRTDRQQLEQVIAQLVENARDAMPEGGELSISTAKTLIPEATQHGGLAIPAGTYVTLEVSDSGEGMDESTKERIFEPFFTTKSDNGENGLGLSMVYAIVRQSEGSIAVESEPGKGSTFFVHLPLQPVPASAAEAAKPANDTANEEETAIVVEDDASIREMVASLLRDHGVQVLSAYSVDTAWVAARQHRGPLQLIVTDLVLPDGTGPDVAGQIARIHPEATVLYLSLAVSGPVSPSSLEPAGDVIEQPFTPEKLRKHFAAAFTARRAPAVQPG